MLRGLLVSSLLACASLGVAQLTPLVSHTRLEINLRVQGAEVDFGPPTQQTPALVARPNVSAPFDHEGNTYQGFALELQNRSQGAMRVRSIDGAIDLVREARNSAGEFVPVEEPRLASCGLSHYQVVLPAGTTWTLPVPAYGGSVRTDMRFRLGGYQTPVYSNVFEGRVSPGQLSR